MKSPVERFRYDISLDTFRSRRLDHTVFHKWLIKQTNSPCNFRLCDCHGRDAPDPVASVTPPVAVCVTLLLLLLSASLGADVSGGSSLMTLPVLPPLLSPFPSFFLFFFSYIYRKREIERDRER
jgi:hypothetical protein